MDDKILYKDLSYKIVGLAMQAHTELGYGFLEKVYENALAVLLREHGIAFHQQLPIKVNFHGHTIGEYIADFIIDNSIIVELKAAERIMDAHKAQTINYLKATG